MANDMSRQLRKQVNAIAQGVEMDIRQVITDKIIAMLEQGGNVASKRWAAASKDGFPRNAKTNISYRGVNVLLLWNEAAERGYASNSWLTYKQAAALGAQVRKGEKAVMCAYFEMVKRKGDSNESSSTEPGDTPGFFPMCKPFWLFNVAQIDGLPESLTKTAKPASPFDPIQNAEQLIASTGANICHGHDGAFYMPSLDKICLPERERFTSSANYYATALHEVMHWTGHESRLDRKFGKRFGDDAYAFEELVAELGAAFVMGHVGLVDATIENHAAYLESWLKVLKNDKSAIFTASKNASLAYELIVKKSSTETESEVCAN